MTSAGVHLIGHSCVPCKWPGIQTTLPQWHSEFHNTYMFIVAAMWQGQNIPVEDNQRLWSSS